MAEKRVYNKIFDEQEYRLVNPENIEIIDVFILVYTQRKIKPITIKQ